MATKMNKYQDGGKVTRSEKKQIRQGVKTRVNELKDVLKDSEYSIGPLEALKMRITGNRHVIKEAKNAKKSKMKTGGMVNPNAKLQAAKSAGSKGVMSGVNPKATASKVAKGRSGGTSVAPKKAIPKASYGMSMTKMTKK